MAHGAGQLAARATFKTRSEAKDDTGEYPVTFEAISPELTRHPCRFRPERGWERDEAGRQQSSIRGTLKIRASTATRSITTRDTLTLHSMQGIPDRDFNIVDIDNMDERGRYLYMTIESGKAER